MLGSSKLPQYCVQYTHYIIIFSSTCSIDCISVPPNVYMSTKKSTIMKEHQQQNITCVVGRVKPVTDISTIKMMIHTSDLQCAEATIDTYHPGGLAESVKTVCTLTMTR